ncbi:MAG: sarcosine oxidase subunit gamma, partial [Rhodobacteraceae bacterium]|nr:sarcosine oxidase subunit gamma [Paracoccaceae bacterium]
IWAGPGRALIIGAALPATLLAELRPLAAVTDQSGAQAMLGLTGAASEAVLARMVAVDLRPAAFAIGQVALCDIGHMPGMVLRTCTQSYELMVMRSMAATLLHEVCDAAKRVAASADGG